MASARGGEEGSGIQFGRENTEALYDYVGMHHDWSCLVGDLIMCLPPLPWLPAVLTDWYGSNREAFLELHHSLCQWSRDCFVGAGKYTPRLAE